MVLPTTMKMNSTQPSSGLQSAKVKGTRSPVSLARTIRNWPACAWRATWGASMRNLNTFSENCVLSRILYINELLSQYFRVPPARSPRADRPHHVP